MKIVLVTNGPVPYRIPALNELAAMSGVSLHVIFCCGREPNREWDLPAIEFRCTYLRERIIRIGDRYIHNNPDVLPTLRRLQPDIVITSGFNPTHLYAFLYAWLKQIPHVAMTDGTLDSEKSLSLLHRQVRQLVYARSTAFIWASTGGQKLYASYGIAEERCFRACLSVENARFSDTEAFRHGKFEFIFCGRLERVKNPWFALDVADEVARRLGRKVRILFVGTGKEEQALKLRCASRKDLVEAVFHGFASQEALPGLYRSAQIFLFPTSWDPWGVVTNEACAAKLPVLVSPHAGVAGELVLDGENGYVCELDVGTWANRAVALLTRPDLYRAFSERSHSLVGQFTFRDACVGLADACRYAATRRVREKSKQQE
jgi:glycosyltransferase involved in cell wall biosynthesis